VHGMAQRGGSVESHVRFGEEVFSPLIEQGQADFFVPFFKSEHDRLISFMSAAGKDLLPDLTNAHLNCRNQKFANTYMLGRLSKYLNISRESWLKALEVGFKGRFVEENRAIFEQAASE